MMSTGHALSGAAVGYTASLLFQYFTDTELHWVVPHAVAAINAGWAGWPDCDTRKAMVTTSLGAPTIAMHKLVVRACAAIYWATATPYDDNTPVIHRGATHTWPGAVFMGLVVTALILAYPRVATPIILGISLHWATRGLYMPTSPDKQLSESRLRGRSFVDQIGIVIYHRMGVALKHRAVAMMRSKFVPLPGKYLRKIGRTGTFVLCLVAAVYATEVATDVFDTRWAALLGGCATLGILTHMVGDSVTESGICWLFPFVHPRSGKRWHPVRFPKWFAFKTGRAFEIGVVYPACLMACVIAMPGGYVLVMQLLGAISAAWRDPPAMPTALPSAHG